MQRCSFPRLRGRISKSSAVFFAATAVSITCLGLCSAGRMGAEVITYPQPQELLSRDYDVSVDGQSLNVCRARVLDPPFSKWGRDYGGDYTPPTTSAPCPLTTSLF